MRADQHASGTSTKSRRGRWLAEVRDDEIGVTSAFPLLWRQQHAAAMQGLTPWVQETRVGPVEHSFAWRDVIGFHEGGHCEAGCNTLQREGRSFRFHDALLNA